MWVLIALIPDLCILFTFYKSNLDVGRHNVDFTTVTMKLLNHM